MDLQLEVKMPAFHTWRAQVGFLTVAPDSQLPNSTDSKRELMMTQLIGFLPPKWEAWTVFLTPESGPGK